MRLETQSVEDPLRAGVDSPSSDLLEAQCSHPLDGIRAHREAHPGSLLISTRRHVIQVSITLVQIDEKQHEADQHTIAASRNHIVPATAGMWPPLVRRKRRYTHFLELTRHRRQRLKHDPLKQHITLRPSSKHSATVTRGCYSKASQNAGFAASVYGVFGARLVAVRETRPVESVRLADTADGLSVEDLQAFFVGWPQAPSPEKRLEIVRAADEVVVARFGGRVVGIATAITDYRFAAYVPLVEVLPGYQGRGIGSQMVRALLDRLKMCYMIDLVCDDDVVPFYERLAGRRLNAVAWRHRDRL